MEEASKESFINALPDEFMQWLKLSRKRVTSNQFVGLVGISQQASLEIFLTEFFHF